MFQLERPLEDCQSWYTNYYQNLQMLETKYELLLAQKESSFSLDSELGMLGTISYNYKQFNASL